MNHFSQIKITINQRDDVLRLGHSTAPENLTHPAIKTEYPYISECNIAAVTTLYVGCKQSEIVCES